MPITTSVTPSTPIMEFSLITQIRGNVVYWTQMDDALAFNLL